MADKYLDKSGVELLWQKINQLIDKKVKLQNYDESIKIVNNKIAVRISTSENNLLELKPGEGLYAKAPSKMHKLTFGEGDKSYIYDGSEDVTVPVYTGKY